MARVGQAVNLAVERFVTVGETIADDNQEIRVDMYDVSAIPPYLLQKIGT